MDSLNQSCKPHSPQIDVPSASDNFYRQDSFSRVDAFVIADNIADFSADVFNQIKLIIDECFDDGSDNENGTDTFTVQSEDGENSPSDPELDDEASHGTSVMAVRLYSPGTDSMYFESEEEMEFDTNGQNVPNVAEFAASVSIEDEDMADNTIVPEDMGNDPLFSSPAAYAQGDEYMVGDAHFDDVDFDGGNQIDYSPATSQAMEFGDDQQLEELQEGMDEDPVQVTPSNKGKGPQQSPRIAIDHFNNDLYSVVMGENNPNWPPAFYKCKIEGCGTQGAWRAKQVHFEIQHAAQWKEATGREAKQFQCPVETCDYETPRSNYIARHIKSRHPEYQASKSTTPKRCKK